MDFSNLINMGAQLLNDNDSVNVDQNAITDALGGLLGGNGSFDISSLLGNLNNSNLQEVVSSWIGNGENLPIDADGVKELLGEEKLQEFASKLDLDTDNASNVLASSLPQLIDNATNDSAVSDMLEQVGGVDGAMDMFKKMFG